MRGHGGIAAVLKVKVIARVELGPKPAAPLGISNHGVKVDALIDFDAVVRDPQRRSRLRPEFDSGDHLHLQDSGYAAMAAHVDLALLDPSPTGS